MTSPLHALAFDTGPLSWVIGEIRDALERSGSALLDAATRSSEAQPTLLLHAKTHLHQAHGALQMVDVEGVGLLTGAAERALEAFKEGRLACTQESAQPVRAAYGAIGEYLEELVAGAAPQPLRLFPYYRALQELLGVERIHPSELLAVDTTATLDLPPPSGGAPDYARCRANVEKALLPYLKSTDDAARARNAQALAEALAPLADAGIDARARTFWSALHSVAALVASGELAGDLYVKQLFGQVNLQLRRLSQGQMQLAESLLRDALFFIAALPRVEAGSEAAQLRRVFRLDGAVPADYNERRYGKVDPGALKQAKEALARSKSDWDQLAVQADPVCEADFNEALATLAGASDKLGAPALAQLLRELGEAANASIASGRSDQFSLEMATAMLFVEQGLDQVRQLPADFDQHAEVVGQRLLALAAGAPLPAAPQWQNELTRQTQQGQTVAVLAGEIKTGLRQVEKLLDEYYDEPQAKRGALAQAATQLHQVEGALSILDQDAAARTAQHVREAVGQLVEGDGDVQAQAGELHNIARNIGALGFFTDMLAQNGDSARSRFAFDAEAGLLRELSYEQAAAQDVPDTVSDSASATVVDFAIDAAPDTPAAAADATADAVADVPLAPHVDTDAALASVPEATVPAQEADVAGIDDELLGIFIEEADEVLGVVATTLPVLERDPAAQEAMTIVRRAFHTLKGSARMVNLDAFGATAAAIERVLNVWLADNRSATPDLLALVAHAHAQLAPWVVELAQAGHSRRDGGALIAAAERVQAGEAFVADAEADDVAEAVLETAAQAPEAVAHAAAEAEVEAVADTAPDAAADAVPDAVADADIDFTESDLAVAGLDATEHPGAEADLAEPEPTADSAADDVAASAVEAVETEETAEDEASPAAEHDAFASNVIALPTATRPLPASEDGTRRVGALDIPLGLYNIYVAETDELLRVLERDFSEWRHEPGRPVTEEALKAAHTLAGTSSTVGFADLRDLAQAIETTLEQLAAPAPTLRPAQHDVLDAALANVREMLEAFSRDELVPAQGAMLEQLANLREELTSQHAAAVYGEAEPELADQLDSLFEETYESLLSDPPVFEEVAAPVPAGSAVGDSGDDALFGLDFDALFDTPAVADAAAVPATLAANDGDAPAADPQPELEAQAALEPELELEPAWEAPAEAPFEASVDAQPEPEAEQIVAPEVEQEHAPAPALEAEPAFEERLEAEPEHQPEQERAEETQADDMAVLPAIEPEAVAEPEPEVVAEFEPEAIAEPEPEAVAEAEAQAVAEPEPEAVAEPEPVVEAEAQAQAQAQAQIETEPAPVPAAVPAPQPQAEPETVARPLALDTVNVGLLAGEPLLRDDLDPDLLPIFLEEAADLLPQIGNGLRQWQHNPADPAPAQGLLRTLHTVKGSARMAGAMRIGQHTHELETQVENMVHAGTTAPAAFDELMANYDQALALFEQLVQPAQAADTEGAEAAQDGTPAAALPLMPASVEALPATEARTPLVRVRADILDRLVTQAGEVSITRSRLENQVEVLKGALVDFSDNLGRLRRQLREVEMQAESQIASRMSIAGEREFDPLEFDRFTRLQELTRMMAESVNDVASFHESLSRTVDGAGEELTAQSRLTRDLQRDLMRVRMVPFASLSERLFRVARQTAKETDKRVNLDIRGGAVEIDRSVLEQMAAPFEHLLRNAIVHGVEPRAVRAAAGKGETGELLVQVSQQGNEVVLQFSDDGAGLDLERIRAKAQAIGLVPPGTELSDAQAAELIFEPGFSTADVLTELAGRGVGMDVVRAEAQALGGRVAIATERGRGARFTIRLPLTLAVTQVVLVASAGKIYALPSTLVEQVMQVREAELVNANAANLIEVGDDVVPFHYLPTLLGEGAGFEPGVRSRPVLVMAGAGERGALLVDEVLGNREVVIKNLGAQLARVPGIAGATVLGSGEIVLILNPLALSRHAGSVVQHIAPAAPVAQPAPVHQPTVMVVDDSLTVRRVTQRLLEREGYRVVLAKDGLDALEQLPEVRPDLMLVDIEMPRMDGFDLVRHVRDDKATSATPIIMITSRTADKHRNYAMGLGVNAYFGKPFQEPVLLGAIAGLLGREMPAA